MRIFHAPTAVVLLLAIGSSGSAEGKMWRERIVWFRLQAQEYEPTPEAQQASRDLREVFGVAGGQFDELQVPNLDGSSPSDFLDTLQKEIARQASTAVILDFECPLHWDDEKKALTCNSVSLDEFVGAVNSQRDAVASSQRRSVVWFLSTPLARGRIPIRQYLEKIVDKFATTLIALPGDEPERASFFRQTAAAIRRLDAESIPSSFDAIDACKGVDSLCVASKALPRHLLSRTIDVFLSSGSGATASCFNLNAQAQLLEAIRTSARAENISVQLVPDKAQSHVACDFSADPLHPEEVIAACEVMGETVPSLAGLTCQGLESWFENDILGRLFRSTPNDEWLAQTGGSAPPGVSAFLRHPHVFILLDRSSSLRVSDPGDEAFSLFRNSSLSWVAQSALSLSILGFGDDTELNECELRTAIGHEEAIDQCFNDFIPTAGYTNLVEALEQLKGHVKDTVANHEDAVVIVMLDGEHSSRYVPELCAEVTAQVQSIHESIVLAKREIARECENDYSDPCFWQWIECLRNLDTPNYSEWLKFDVRTCERERNEAFATDEEPASATLAQCLEQRAREVARSHALYSKIPPSEFELRAKKCPEKSCQRIVRRHDASDCAQARADLDRISEAALVELEHSKYVEPSKLRVLSDECARDTIESQLRSLAGARVRAVQVLRLNYKKSNKVFAGATDQLKNSLGQNWIRFFTYDAAGENDVEQETLRLLGLSVDKIPTPARLDNDGYWRLKHRELIAGPHTGLGVSLGNIALRRGGFAVRPDVPIGLRVLRGTQRIPCGATWSHPELLVSFKAECDVSSRVMNLWWESARNAPRITWEISPYFEVEGTRAVVDVSAENKSPVTGR